MNKRPRRRGISAVELTSFVVYAIAGYWLGNPTFSTSKRIGALVVIVVVLFGNDLRPFRVGVDGIRRRWWLPFAHRLVRLSDIAGLDHSRPSGDRGLGGYDSVIIVKRDGKRTPISETTSRRPSDVDAWIDWISVELEGLGWVPTTGGFDIDSSRRRAT